MDELYTLIMSMNYGEIITHEEIERIIGYIRNTTKYTYIISKVKKQLIPNSRIIKSIPGKGYQLLKNEQVSGYVYRNYIVKAEERLEQGNTILDNLNTKGFGSARGAEFDDVRELSRDLKKTVKKKRIESQYYDRMTYYNSLED